MPGLDFWHPVFLSRKLGRKPVAIRVLDQELVLFRTRAGGVGALRDRCPHRGMRLSKGAVVGERLRCPYHGWSYDAAGQGQSPGTPRLTACADHFEAVERDGAIWIKNPASDAELPDHDVAGFELTSVHHRRVNVPLELVLDNFHEVEHTPTTHTFLGYDLDRMNEVTVETRFEERGVKVVNRGPQRKVPLLIEKLLGVRTGDWFTDEWVTYFSPVHTVYDHWWADPATDEAREDRFRPIVYFVPVDAESTDLVLFAWVHKRDVPRPGLDRIAALAFRLAVELEVYQDSKMLESLADRSTGLRGKKLSRFDKPLVELRRRVQSEYYGR